MPKIDHSTAASITVDFPLFDALSIQRIKEERHESPTNHSCS